MLGKTRKFGGSAVAIIWAVLGVLNFLLGLPGLIDDTNVWLSWLRRTDMIPLHFEFLYPVGIVGGLAIATSDWWFPRIRSVFRARKADTAHVALPIDVDPQDQVEQFKGLVPQLKRLVAHCRPRNALTLQMLIAVDPLILPDIEADYLEVCAHLDSLGIAYPSTEPARGSKVWFYFATHMKQLASQGRLIEAREREYE